MTKSRVKVGEKQPANPLPLQSGDRLSRAEFEQRYQAHPELKAELIEGVVYVSSPVHFKKHAFPHENGVLRSEVFPGLWLSVEAFLRGDLTAVIATLNTGLQSPEHAAFVQKLQVK